MGRNRIPLQSVCLFVMHHCLFVWQAGKLTKHGYFLLPTTTNSAHHHNHTTTQHPLPTTNYNETNHPQTQMTAHTCKWLLTYENSCPLMKTMSCEWKKLPMNTNDHLQKEPTTHKWKWPPTDGNDCTHQGIQMPCCPQQHGNQMTNNIHHSLLNLGYKGSTPFPISSQPILLRYRTISVRRTSFLDWKKDRNWTEPNCKRPDHRLQLHKFWIFSVASCNVCRKSKNRKKPV